MKNTKTAKQNSACCGMACDDAYVQPAIYAGFAVLGWSVGHNLIIGQPGEAFVAIVMFAAVFAVTYVIGKKMK